MADVRPIVGISMGDPFGNGPEISVKSLADKTLYDRCKPLIVGDKSSMEYALAVARKVSGIDLKLNIVKEPAEGKYEYGTIDLIDLGIVPAEKIPNTLDDPKGPQPFHIGACELGGEGDALRFGREDNLGIGGDFLRQRGGAGVDELVVAEHDEARDREIFGHVEDGQLALHASYGQFIISVCHIVFTPSGWRRHGRQSRCRVVRFCTYILIIRFLCIVRKKDFRSVVK